MAATREVTPAHSPLLLAVYVYVVRRIACRVVALAAVAVGFSADGLLRAASPSDPDVRDLVSKALNYLESHTDDRLGGKVLIGLAFHKASLARLCPDDHPRIAEAHAACRQMAEQVARNEQYIYGKALAVIFLAEVGGDRGLMLSYSGMLKDHQQPHGGFGYRNYATGDTSQTQYAALASWELLSHGSRPDAESMQQCINWLLRTQDPSGVWGYQGHDPGTFELVEQPDEPGPSMAAAGMGGLLILGNVLGILVPPNEEAAAVADVPDALKPINLGEQRRGASVDAGGVDRQRVKDAVARGRKWFDDNFTIDAPAYPGYLLYSLERYKSFEEYLDGVVVEEPQWYNDGVKFLVDRHQPNGSWTGASGSACTTAFSILFLLRSTQESIKTSLGQGTLVGGRGLPRDLSRVRLRGGKLVVEQPPTEVDQLLETLGEDDAALDALVDAPNLVEVSDVRPEDARRLQQIVSSGEPEARLLAVRALSQLRDLDYAPTLIFAMTDPDRRVVRAARDGLRLVSRKIDGFGLPDNYEDDQRDRVVDLWKRWYRQIRPEAQFLR